MHEKFPDVTVPTAKLPFIMPSFQWQNDFFSFDGRIWFVHTLKKKIYTYFG